VLSSSLQARKGRRGYGIRYRGKDDVAMVFFGDGATSEGDFHEGLNFAGVFQTPDDDL
jgi:pyruvate dehydrogenase E1 component alpha subunit